MPVTEWLHLEDVGGDAWILPVWTASQRAVDAGRTRLLGPEFGELALYISTRLDIIRRIRRRLDEESAALYEVVRGHGSEYVFTEIRCGRAFPVNADLKYCFIADIDALLFELDSCWALMRELYRGLRAHVGCPVDSGVTTALREALGSDTDWWFRWPDRHRNFVAHEGALYVAIEVTGGNMELLVMRENLSSFADPTRFFRFSELREVSTAFDGLKQALQQVLIRLFGEPDAANRAE